MRVVDILDSALLLFDGQLKPKNIKVIRRFGENATLLCLVGEIQQVFTNLVSNAIDSMQRDGKLWLSVREVVETFVTTKEKAERAWVCGSLARFWTVMGRTYMCVAESAAELRLAWPYRTMELSA